MTATSGSFISWDGFSWWVTQRCFLTAQGVLGPNGASEFCAFLCGFSGCVPQSENTGDFKPPFVKLWHPSSVVPG